MLITRHKLLAICDKLTLIGLYGVLIFIPASIAVTQSSLTLLLLSYLMKAVLTRQFRFPQTPLNLPYLVYMATILMAVLFAPNRGKSLWNAHSVGLVLMFYVVYASVKEWAQLRRFLTVLIGSFTIAAFYGMLQHFWEVDVFRMTQPISFLKHVGNDLRAPVRVPGFISYVTFGGQLAMLIPVVLALCLSVKPWLKKLSLIGVLLLTSCVLLWTYTRGAWVGAVCALTVFGYLWSKKLLFLVPLLLVVLLVVILQPELFDRTLSIFQTTENMERLYTWESTLNMIRDHPIFGIGRGNFSKLAPQYRTQYDFAFTSRAHAHNNLLQVTVENGILTLAAFLWVWIVMVCEMLRIYRRIPPQQSVRKMLSLGLLCATIAFFMHGFFEHNWGDSESVMMLWVLTAFAFKLETIV